MTLDTLNYPLYVLVPMIIFLIYCKWNFKENVCISLFYIIFIFSILFIVNLFCLLVEKNFIQELGQYLYSDKIIYPLCLIANKLILCIVYVYFKNNNILIKGITMKDKQMVMFTITELVMLFLMSLFMSLFMQEEVNLGFSFCIICLLTAIFLLFCYQYIILIKANKKILDEEIKHAHLEFNKNYYEDFQKNYDMNKALSHDLKNHITLIYTMLEENQVKEAMNYIRGVYHKIGTFKSVKSEREILNYIIDSKLFNTKELNIRYVIDINDNLDFMDNIDLCILLGNLLDNCIEAVEKVNNRFIELIIDKNNDVIFISLKNTFDSKSLKYENGEYVTSKSDGKNHGIGMKNIESIINKYNGNIVIDIDEYFNTYIYF